MTIPNLLLCNCQKTMQIDGEALARSLGGEAPFAVYSELCRGEIGVVTTAAKRGQPLRVACAQEAQTFVDALEGNAGTGDRTELPISFVDIRDRAGWCADAGAALPKMAALLADAAHVARPTSLTRLTSEGVCLVIGAGQIALDAATRLAGRLSVTLILTSTEDVVLPAKTEFPIHCGRLRSATGHLGMFDVVVDRFADLLPSSRGIAQFTMPRDGVRARCDVIVDLTGGSAVFQPHQRRDGYLRAEPSDRAAVAGLLFEASDLVGEFEKPVYVRYDAAVCAHSRSGKVGCTKCLDACPTGAITPSGDGVSISAAICGGCGSCSAVCPTGAAEYAYPDRTDALARLQIMHAAYKGAGGTRPVLLLHDERHGAALINASARFGRGLPVNVIPLAQYAVFQTGHEVLLAALATGYQHVVCLLPPDSTHDRPVLEAQVALAHAITTGLGIDGPRFHPLEADDPDALEDVLYGMAHVSALEGAAFAVDGGRRELARLALSRLKEQAGPRAPDIVSLPKGAPYGLVAIDQEGCTLCIACVGSCPTGALSENPTRPMVSFTESACVQCGLCVSTCPERVITLIPRLNLGLSALEPVVLNEDEPFACVRCGKEFGSKATIDAISKRLAGHSMFRDAKQLEAIQMCDNCRVVTIAESGADPFNLGPRPAIRTTDDELRADGRSDDARPKQPRKPDDFLS
ncbi:MAG: 4Fe-4S binding protein [Hyphomicrobiaceae bacterium]